MRMVRSAAAMVLLLTATTALAQTTVSLSSSTNREVWRGETTGSEFSTYLDRGQLNADTRRDLIIGAPGWNSDQGRVYVVFSGPVRGGEVPATSADLIFTGGATGDRFGSATAAGWITTRELDVPQLSRDLIIGAPDANSGAGAVYLFKRANFVNGQRFSPADAVLTINGAAGDHLGSALATGDMDGDGYREMILGAPGNSRVYVIKGGSSVSGTINLSSTPAEMTIDGPSGAGIGSVLASGDITGDTSYDLAIGAPDLAPAGAVYVIAGHATGGIASAVHLGSGGADVTLTGTDAGDRAGASLAIGPFDTDVKWDLLIGAPNAAGPGNARPNAGEVYAMFGSTAMTSRSLGAADLTIFGAGAGFHTGAALAMGDVDRSGTYDLAMLASGASGIGEIHVVLGRDRSLFGSSIDLNNGIDRRIVADPAAGAITSILIYDHTGEGADDILAGFPASNQGLLYIAFSPLPEAYMSYPTDGTVLGGVSQAFQWNAAPNALQYRLTIGSSSGTADLYDTGAISATSAMVPETLPRNQTLYARIYTDVAGSWRFHDSTFTLLPGATWLYPTNNISGVKPTYFSWAAVGGGATYEVQVGTTLGGNDLADSGTLTASRYLVFSLPPNQTLYARVISSLNGGSTSTDVTFMSAPVTTGGADSPGHGMGANFGGATGGDAFLYNPSSGAWSMQISASGNFVGVNSAVWAKNWTVQAGDFNGDGLEDLFLYNPTTGQWFKVMNLGGGSFSYDTGRWAPNWTVTIADFDGDGRSDVFLYNPTNGQWFKCLNLGEGNGNADFNYIGGTWAPHWSIYPADFNGDGHADLFLYNHSGDANSGLWYRVISQPDNSFSYLAGEVRWASNWTVIPADFNGDGQDDLFLYDASSGNYFRVTWPNGVTTYTGGRWGANWTIRKADFNGDGLADLFLYNNSNGQWFQVITQRDGSLAYYGGTWATNWNITATDFDSDGRTDLLLYNSSTGQWFQAITVGLGSFSFNTGNWGTGWTVVAGRTILP